MDERRLREAADCRRVYEVETQQIPHMGTASTYPETVVTVHNTWDDALHYARSIKASYDRVLITERYLIR